MKLKLKPSTQEQFLIGWRLDMVLDPRQEIYRLAGVIDWASLEAESGGLYCPEPDVTGC